MLGGWKAGDDFGELSRAVADGGQDGHHHDQPKARQLQQVGHELRPLQPGGPHQQGNRRHPRRPRQRATHPPDCRRIPPPHGPSHAMGRDPTLTPLTHKWRQAAELDRCTCRHRTKQSSLKGDHQIPVRPREQAKQNPHNPANPRPKKGAHDANEMLLLHPGNHRPR